MVCSKITSHKFRGTPTKLCTLRKKLKKNLINMKFVSVVFVLFALIAAVASLAPTPPSHCDYKCNLEDVAVYAYNGRCYLKMQGKCHLDRYNCLNPQKVFREVQEAQYSADAAPKCQTKDY